ncbi:hypothetical protein K501DRAFT_229718, partial [Backusella circina FSU 941]
MQDFKMSNTSLFMNAPSNQDILNALNDMVPKNESYQRVRLLIDTSSHITVEHTPIPTPDSSFGMLDEAALSDPCFNVTLDILPIQDPHQDPFIMHKTTFRDVYNTARERTACEWHPAQYQPFDVILYNNKQQVTETSIANIAIGFPENGKRVWKTPQVECGLLPGVFRSYLISTKQVQQDIITLDELKLAQQNGYPIICFNSVRKAYR